jgi:hypothetical protein
MAAGCVELLVRLQGLLQVISLRPLIIEDGEGSLGWLGAAIPGSDERFLSTRPGAQETVRRKKPGRFVRNDIGSWAARVSQGLRPGLTCDAPTALRRKAHATVGGRYKVRSASLAPPAAARLASRAKARPLQRMATRHYKIRSATSELIRRRSVYFTLFS